MNECISNHSWCMNKISTTRFVPTRLLDIGGCKTTSARLIESNKKTLVRHWKTQLRYATLSYCWGGSLSMTTTKANKREHETTGIDIRNMPATFQDAIYVVKKLGIRYIWIDALCIVQDDHEDWEAESVAMCDVFAHSKVTICAAKCSSPEEHFLLRPTDDLLSLHFRSTLRPHISGQYSIRLEPRHVSPASQDLENSAWISRAWVWQEQITSTRQLVFGNKTLQFRCPRGTLFEDGRRDLRNTTLDTLHNPETWRHAMETYSSRTLTYASDRLKAIAGVASFIENYYFEETTRPSYLVGLWKNNEVEFQLRWVCRKPSLSHAELLGLLRDREQYIAPSWSWVSRNTGIRHLWNGEHTEFQVIKSDLKASHKSAMVSVAFGSSITVSGKFRQTPVEPSSGHFMTDFPWPHRWEASSDYGLTKFWLDWVPKINDTEESTSQSQLYLFLTCVFPKMAWEYVGGLIIERFIDPGTGDAFYYRVGVFVHRGDIGMMTNELAREITIR